MRPRFSIIIPIYNEETYLREAIDSVLAQTVSDWELLLVDDGSTDNSFAICADYAAMDKRIRVLRQPNRGLSAARNAGLAAAKGEWIAFLDGDDLLPPAALETYFAHTENADAVIAAFERFPEHTVIRTADKVEYYADFPAMEKDFVRLYYNLMTCVTMLIRADRVQRFDETIPYCADVAFVMEQLGVCRGIRIIPDVLYHYRWTQETTLSNRFFLDHTWSGKRIFQTVCAHFPASAEIKRFMAGRYALLTIKYLCALCSIERLSEAQKHALILPVLEDEVRDDPVWTVDLVPPDAPQRMLWEAVISRDADRVYDACMEALTPHVSIIVPVYQAEATLRRTIESVRRQTEANWELLLVDDGSSDGSAALCASCAASDRRIRVYHTEHRGVSAARNFALEHARGEWVQFLDADDTLDEHCLEALLYHTVDAERVCCGFQWVPNGRACVPCKQNVLCRSLSDIEALDEYFPLLTVVWSGIFRLDTLTSRFDERLTVGEDIVFNAEWFRSTRTVRVLPDVLYRYRSSPPAPPRIDTLSAQEAIDRRVREAYRGSARMVRWFTVNLIEVCIRWFESVIQNASLSEPQKRLLVATQLDSALLDGHIPDYPGDDKRCRALWQALLSRDTDVILRTFSKS